MYTFTKFYTIGASLTDKSVSVLLNLSYTVRACGACVSTEEWEAQRRARLESDAGGEDAVALRLRRADEDKRRILAEFEEKARDRSDEMGARESALRERQANAELAKQQSLQQLYEMNRSKAAAYNQGTSLPSTSIVCTSYPVPSTRFPSRLSESHFDSSSIGACYSCLVHSVETERSLGVGGSIEIKC